LSALIFIAVLIFIGSRVWGIFDNNDNPSVALIPSTSSPSSVQTTQPEIEPVPIPSEDSPLQTISLSTVTVCPCSKEISQNGAHNQRGIVTIKVEQKLDDKRIIWIEDLVAIAEQSASSDVYTLQRRVDEKSITEKMFSNPAFVEYVVRNIVISLREQVDNIGYSVKCENSESINPHNAYAEVFGKC
jgi:GTP cyclohydrolase FolE2